MIDTQGVGRAIMRAQHVGTDDKPIFRVVMKAIAYQSIPPIGRIGVSCECMTDPKYIAAVGVEGAVGGIGQLEPSEFAAEFQWKNVGVFKRMYCQGK